MSYAKQDMLIISVYLISTRSFVGVCGYPSFSSVASLYFLLFVLVPPTVHTNLTNAFVGSFTWVFLSLINGSSCLAVLSQASSMLKLIRQLQISFEYCGTIFTREASV
jgi:exosortase/archaeosortase